MPVDVDDANHEWASRPLVYIGAAGCANECGTLVFEREDAFARDWVTHATLIAEDSPAFRVLSDLCDGPHGSPTDPAAAKQFRVKSLQVLAFVPPIAVAE